MCAAVSTTPCRTTAGMVSPTGPGMPICCGISPTTSATACGVAGDGVSNRTRSAANLPSAMSTGAPLIPVPPMSIPTTTPDATFAVFAWSSIIRSFLLGTAPAVAPSDRLAIAVELVVLVVATLPRTQVCEALDELDGLDPLDVLEAQLKFVTQPQ